MGDLINKSELQKYGLSAHDLLSKFKEQLLKDFAMSNAEHFLQPINDFSYESIHLNLSNALKKISDSGHAMYQNLLYRTDISEKQYRQALKENKKPESHEVMADLIIKRVLQKVILKLIYSKKQ